MSNYLTTFNNLTEYNAFLDSNDCPPINVSYITSTSEVKYYKDTPSITPFTIEIDTLPDGVSEIYPKFNLQQFDPNYSFGGKKIWVKYKINDGAWTLYPSTFDSRPDGGFTSMVNIEEQLTTGDKISFISNGMEKSLSLNADSWFLEQYTEGLRVNISGNILSTAYGDDYVWATPDHYEGTQLRFNYIFQYSNFLKDASDLILPTHNLPEPTDDSNGVFQFMFLGCSNLEYGPNILAKELPNRACKNMFEGCESLTTPVIIAAKVANDTTFDWMYNRCIGIQSIDFDEILPNIETIKGQYTFCSMFRECSGLQTISNLGALVNKLNYIDVNYPFQEMFIGCVNLDITSDSEVFNLDAEIIENRGFYNSMFRDCHSLTHTPVLKDIISSDSIFGWCGSITHLYWLGSYWPNDQLGEGWNAAVGTLYYNGDITLDYEPNNVIPEGWTATAYTPSNG